MPPNIQKMAILITTWLSDPANHTMHYPAWNETGDPLSDLYRSLSGWRTHQEHLDWQAESDNPNEQ